MILTETCGKKPVIGISIGDPSGIGPEICVKVLTLKEVYYAAIPVVYGDRVVLENALKITGSNFSVRRIENPGEAEGNFGTIDFIDVGIITRPDECTYGQINAKSGDASFRYIVKAIDDAMSGALAAVVTCPISKEAINLAGHNFAGHTEIFAHYTNTADYGMMLSAKAGAAKAESAKACIASIGENTLNVIHVTTHVSLRRACELVTKERVLKTIYLAQKALTLMGIENGRIAVAGLNPHSSENGMFGNEENDFIIPAIREAVAQGMNVAGPLPPDTVFAKALGGQYDIVVAMYHDQGHIPLKLCGFKASSGGVSGVRGVNATIGLPIIRTSVDHGTAFDIAGKNLADFHSLLDAIYMAVRFIKYR